MVKQSLEQQWHVSDIYPNSAIMSTGPFGLNGTMV